MVRPATGADRYNAFDRLVGRTADPDGEAGGGAVQAEHFVYDGAQILLHFDGSAASDLAHCYLWGAAVDELLADEAVASLGTPGEVRWPLTDHLGTVRELVDSDGDVLLHRDYDAFGRVLTQTGAVDALFAFTGKLLDADTGLQNHWHRWYDAEVGEWLSEDPIEFGGRDVNPYRYVGNSPLRAADPSGLVVRVVEVEGGEAEGKPESIQVTQPETNVSALKEAVAILERLTDEDFERIKTHGSVKFMGEPFTGTRKDYLELIEREREKVSNEKRCQEPLSVIGS